MDGGKYTGFESVSQTHQRGNGQKRLYSGGTSDGHGLAGFQLMYKNDKFDSDPQHQDRKQDLADASPGKFCYGGYLHERHTVTR